MLYLSGTTVLLLQSLFTPPTPIDLYYLYNPQIGPYIPNSSTVTITLAVIVYHVTHTYHALFLL